MIVLKFGGTSVGDADAIKRTASIVRTRLDRKPIVVVSAMSGVTNALLAIGEQAAKGHLIGAVRSVEAIRERHIQAAETLLGTTPECADLCGEISALCDELAHLAEALRTLGDVTPRSFDQIAALGEQLSSMLVAAVYCREGLPAVHVDGRRVIITDDAYMKAEPQPEAIAEASRAEILSQVTAGKIPVMGGFIGSAKGRGTTTTLGRGGGDYSASLVGAAIRAEAIEIWTDVDGMLTADPRVVPEARLIERIGFDEASELASFGAKVLHPSTIAPAVRLGIPVLILNSKRPEGAGTVITFEAPRRGVSAIAGKNDVTLIRVGSPRMLLTHGFMRQLFDVFARHRTSIDVVATSEVSVSVTMDDPSRLPALLPDLRELGDVALERHRGIVAVVGAALREGGSHMSRAMSALGDVSVHMLSLSATGINLTIVVDDDQVKPAMKRLHDEFFGKGSS